MFSTPRRRHIGWALLFTVSAAVILGVVTLVVVGVQTLVAVRQTQLEGTPLGQQLKQSSNRILDCTEPEGDCYKDGQRRTAKAVGDINRVIVLAAACSVGLDQNLTVDERQTEIQSCVIDRLARQAQKP